MNPLNQNAQCHYLELASSEKSGAFPTTRWSVVLGVVQTESEAAAAALEELCRIYWYPIYAFVRQRGAGPHEAEDLTQSFFAFVLEKESLRSVNQAKGRFRSFLLAVLTNFLNNEWHRRQRLKRGGGHRFLSFDELKAEERYCLEPADPLTPEDVFERGWVIVLLDRVLKRLKQEYVAEGNGDLFEKLEAGLTGEPAGKYEQWAAALGMSKGAVKVALHRMRRRFGEALRHEIAHTVSSPAEVDEEIRYLFAAVSD